MHVEGGGVVERLLDGLVDTGELLEGVEHLPAFAARLERPPQLQFGLRLLIQSFLRTHYRVLGLKGRIKVFGGSGRVLRIFRHLNEIGYFFL